MATLGSFGAAVRELDPDADRDTFDFFDQPFTVEGVLPGMLVMQLGAMLAGKASTVDGLAAIYEALRCALTTPAREVGGKQVDADDTQFNRFYRLAVRTRCDEDELIRLVLNIAGYQVGKADEPPPTSPSGPSPISPSSNSSSSVSPDSLPVETPSAG